MTKPMSIFQKFWKRVDKNGPNGCWNWTGGKTMAGYARFSTASTYAYRFSYELVFGSIEGKEIHHKCKNHACVNPAHLEAVLPSEHPDGGTLIHRFQTH